MHKIVTLWQVLTYGALKRTPNIDFSEIPDQLRFVSHYDKVNDVHWVEVPDLPEFIVSGKTTKDLAENFTDTLLTYFDVPTYYAKRFKPSITELKIINQKTNEEEVITLSHKEELDKVLA